MVVSLPTLPLLLLMVLAGAGLIYGLLVYLERRDTVAFVLAVMVLVVLFAIAVQPWRWFIGMLAPAEIAQCSPKPSREHSATSVIGGPTLSAAFVDRVLEAASSPAKGKGQVLCTLSQKYHIDDAYALAVYAHESSYGTKGVALLTKSLGNIICTVGYPSCSGRFRSYATFEAACEDFYRLIAVEYIAGRGVTTVEQITPIYAPAKENNVRAYIRAVVSLMAAYRAGRLE